MIFFTYLILDLVLIPQISTLHLKEDVYIVVQTVKIVKMGINAMNVQKVFSSISYLLVSLALTSFASHAILLLLIIPVKSALRGLQ